IYHNGLSGYAIGSHDLLCSEILTMLVANGDGREPLRFDQALPLELLYALRPLIIRVARDVSLPIEVERGRYETGRIEDGVNAALLVETFELANLYGTGRDRKALARLIDLLITQPGIQPTEMAQMRLSTEFSNWLEKRNLLGRFPLLNDAISGIHARGFDSWSGDMCHFVSRGPGFEPR
ncbi:hypothetical protein FOZ63_001060, partial [Perkinsus olseni]